VRIKLLSHKGELVEKNENMRTMADDSLCERNKKLKLFLKNFLCFLIPHAGVNITNKNARQKFHSLGMLIHTTAPEKAQKFSIWITKRGEKKYTNK
jgi:hypothetical protein